MTFFVRTVQNLGIAMPPTPLTGEHHVARQCRNRLLIRIGGEVVGVFSDAFALRPQETYLSFAWLERFVGARTAQLAAVRDAIIASGRTIKPKDGLAVLNVERAVAAGKASLSAKIRILHEPSGSNPAYTAFRGIRRDDAALLDRLADECKGATVEVGSLDGVAAAPPF